MSDRPFKGMPLHSVIHAINQQASRVQNHPMVLFQTTHFPIANRETINHLKALVVHTQIIGFLLLECSSMHGRVMPKAVPDPEVDWYPMLKLLADRCERWKTDLAGVPNWCETIVQDFLKEIHDWVPGDTLQLATQEVKIPPPKAGDVVPNFRADPECVNIYWSPREEFAKTGTLQHWSLSGSQSAMTAELHRAWESGFPDVKNSRLLEKAGLPDTSDPRDSFKHTPNEGLWGSGRLIVPGKAQGTRRLNLSDADDLGPKHRR